MNSQLNTRIPLYATKKRITTRATAPVNPRVVIREMKKFSLKLNFFLWTNSKGVWVLFASEWIGLESPFLAAASGRPSFITSVKFLSKLIPSLLSLWLYISWR